MVYLALILERTHWFQRGILVPGMLMDERYRFATLDDPSWALQCDGGDGYLLMVRDDIIFEWKTYVLGMKKRKGLGTLILARRAILNVYLES